MRLLFPHLLERDRDGSDGVVVRAALQRRENGEVDLVLEVVDYLLALRVPRPYALSALSDASLFPSASFLFLSLTTISQ